jgi:hypothetical protein
VRLPAAFGAWLVLTAVAAPRAAAQDTHLLIVTGVAGSDQHAERFHTWAAAIVESTRRLGLPDANITYLADSPDLDASIRGRSTRDNVTKALGDIAARARPDDEVFIILIGHGSYDGRMGAFNLPGPDLTAADYATLLKAFASQPVVFVNTASSSGAFLAPLAGPGRTIVTATRSGGERNETRFPEFFVEALQSDKADGDRNGRVSIFEAFEYARTRVATSYEQSGHIPTEHPTLDDGSEGKIAGMLYLAPRRSRTAEIAGGDPALRTLVEEQEALERQVAGLRLRKDVMEAAAYERELERLLTELALKTRAIRDLEAKR